MKVPPRRYAAIVRRARAGEPYAEIARRFGLSAKYVNEIALREGVRRHAPAGTGRHRALVMCDGCDKKVRSRTGLCVDCYRTGMRNEIELANGSWVLDKRARILRWETAA